TRELKFFVSNASAGAPLEWLLHVAFSRWPIEQCFHEEKDELGFDHFEVRRWLSIHRHMHLSQVSHLFLNRMRQTLVAQEHATQVAHPWEIFFPRRRASARSLSPRKPDGRAAALRPVAVAAGPASGTPRRADDSGRRGE